MSATQEADIFWLTRRQLDLFKELREHGTRFTDGLRQSTIDALTSIGLAWESTAGSVGLSSRGRFSTLVTGGGVRVPRQLTEKQRAILDAEMDAEMQS